MTTRGADHSTLLSSVADHLNMRFSPAERRRLSAITALGLVLRVVYQINRSFVGDEAGTIHWISTSSYGFLFTHFIDPWLSMPIYLMLEKLLAELSGYSEWVLVLPSL